MAIVRVNNKEYLENNNAVADRKITFLGIPLFHSVQRTVNINIINSLGGTKTKQCMTIVKGFNYEDKDKEIK